MNRFCSATFTCTRKWSDGRLSIREVVDLYGQTGRFDVIAITDHILMKRDLLARAGRLPRSAGALLGDRGSVRRLPGRHRRRRRARARRLYDLLVIPGAEITQNHFRSKKNSHIVALNIREYISADQPAEDILREIRAAGRAQHRLPSAPPDDPADRDQHVLSLGPPQAAGRTWSTCGRPPTATICSR